MTIQTLASGIIGKATALFQNTGISPRTATITLGLFTTSCISTMFGLTQAPLFAALAGVNAGLTVFAVLVSEPRTPVTPDDLTPDEYVAAHIEAGYDSDYATKSMFNAGDDDVGSPYMSTNNRLAAHLVLAHDYDDEKAMEWVALFDAPTGLRCDCGWLTTGIETPTCGECLDSLCDGCPTPSAY